MKITHEDRASDGVVIPDVLGYDNSDSLLQIYGRLYI